MGKQSQGLGPYQVRLGALEGGEGEDVVGDALERRRGGVHVHDVAVQVASERHILKPGLIFKGKGLKPVAFKLWVNRVQLAPPHHEREEPARPQHAVRLGDDVGRG
jgi:hypothetical protein